MKVGEEKRENKSRIMIQHEDQEKNLTGKTDREHDRRVAKSNETLIG